MHREVPFWFALILVFLFISPGFGQGLSQAWVARYSGPGAGDNVATALATDDSGNVYVTGYSLGIGTGRDFATIKYAPSGDTLWVRRYNGPDSYDDQASALAVDKNGNVYVTGYSTSRMNGPDFATIKYAPNGTLLWSRRYNGPGNGDDKASALKIDGSGNVNVTGQSLGIGTAEDYATIKYSPNGDSLWVRRYNGPANSADEPAGLAIDGNGNAYVTGKSWGGRSWDFATIKYGPNGNLQWVKRFNEVSDADQPAALAVDATGNVYVTGQTWIWGRGTSYDFATLKYDSQGNLLWARYYEGITNDHSFPVAAALDGKGNLYLTGQSWTGRTSYDYATLKYAANGNQIWVRDYNGPSGGGDEASAMAVDANGNVFVTGRTYVWTGQARYDYATVEYAPDGTQLWARDYSGTSGRNQATALAVDNQGNLYVTGSSQGSFGHYDYATVRYSPCAVASPVAGDADGNGRIDLADIVELINYVFDKPGYPPCRSNSNLCWVGGVLCRGDWNGDGMITLTDLVQVVGYVFERPGGPWNSVPSGVCCQSAP